MGLSKWTKQAQEMVGKHSDKLNAGIDKTAAKAKTSQPKHANKVDKLAKYAKDAVEKSKKS